MRGIAVAVVIVVGLVGRAEAAPPARPAELMAIVTVSAPALSGLRAFLNGAYPGSGSAADVNTFLAMAGVPVAGLEVARSPVHLLVVHAHGSPGMAIAAKVADPTKLSPGRSGVTVRTGGGWAVIGYRAADLDLVAPWALATLPKAPPPVLPAATFYTRPLMAFATPFMSSIRTALTTEAKTPAMRDAMSAYIDGFLSVAADTDAIELRLEADADLATLDAALVPRAGTRFAQFAAAQKPSDFGLVGKLPAAQAAMLFGGRVVAGPYRDGFYALALSMFTGTSSGKGLSDAVGAIMKSSTGEFAVTAQLDKKRGMTAVSLFPLDDPRGTDRAIDAAIKELGGKGLRRDSVTPAETWTAFARAGLHDGVTLRGYRIKYDAPKTADERRAQEMAAPSGKSEGVVAVIEGRGEPPLGMTAQGPDGVVEGARVIDALRGKAPRLTLPKTMGQLVENARAHKDSAIIAFDAGAFAAALGLPITDEATFVMTAGFDGNVRIRTLVPAASVRTAIAIANAATAARMATP